MSRLIDADKLKAHYAWWKGGSREMTMDEAKSDFDCIIDLQPTVEVEPVEVRATYMQKAYDEGYADGRREAGDPKYGLWMPVTVSGVYKCSLCSNGMMTSNIKDYNFCPHCGAKMTGIMKDEPAEAEVLSVYIKREEIE